MYPNSPKITVALILVIACILSATSVYAQTHGSPIAFSKRVGPLLDASEKAYFRLFPDIDNFESAQVFPSTDSSFVVNIQHTNSASTERVMSGKELAEIGRYIDRYEHVYANTKAVEWGYLIKHVESNNDPFQRGISVRVTLKDGTAAEGRLVHINEAGLLISREIDSMAPIAMKDQVHYFRPEEISRIRQFGTFFEKAFGEVEIFFAGEPDIYHADTYPILKEFAFYREAPPPELMAAMAPAQQGSTDGEYQKPERDPRFSRNTVMKDFRVRYYPAGVPLFDNADPVIVDAFRRSVADLQQVPSDIRFKPPYAGFAIDYSVSERIKVGAAAFFSQQPKAGEAIDIEIPIREIVETESLFNFRQTPAFIEVGGNQFVGKITYDLVSADRVLGVHPKLTSNIFDLTVGAGVSVWAQQALSTLRSATYEGLIGGNWIQYEGSETSENTLLGFYGEIEINFYTSRYFSLGMNITQFMYPGFTIEEHALDARGMIPVGKSHPGISQTLSRTTINGMLAFHF